MHYGSNNHWHNHMLRPVVADRYIRGAKYIYNKLTEKNMAPVHKEKKRKFHHPHNKWNITPNHNHPVHVFRKESNMAGWKHKKIEEPMHGDDIRSGYTGTGMKLKIHKRPKEFIAAGLVKTSQVYSTYIGFPTGMQGYADLAYVGTMSQTIGFANGVMQGNTWQEQIPYWSVQPDRTIPSSTGYFSNVNADPPFNRICLRTVQFTIDVANVTNNPVYVDLVLVKAKKDVPRYADPATLQKFVAGRSPLTQWQEFSKMGALGHAIQAFNATAGSGTVGYIDVRQPGAKPTDIHEWNKYYKTVKVHSLHLGPMGMETVNIHIDYNQIFDIAKTLELGNQTGPNIPDTNLNIELMKGGLFLYGIVRGTVADAGSGTNNYTFAPGNVAFGIIKKQVFSFLKTPSSKAVSWIGADTMSALGSVAYNIQATSTGDAIKGIQTNE